jgi:ubiquinone biosynthesis protein UbiJ
MFYTLGRGRGGNVYVYALKMKQFVFSSEIIQTGNVEIDSQIFDSYPRSTLALANTTVFPASTGAFLPGEIIYQGDSLATANAQAIVHSYTPDTSISIIRVRGQFATGNVTGNTSGALRSALVYNDDSQVGNNIFEDIADNVRIETESDAILDWTERNPFGEA